MAINSQLKPFSLQIYIWFVMGCILIAVSMFYFQHAINVNVLKPMVEATILGGLFVVIKYRFKSLWFLSAILCLLLIFLLKEYLFSKWFHSIFLKSELLTYSAGFYCIFYGICLRKNSDIKILKIITVLSMPILIPYSVIIIMGLVLGESQGGMVAAYWFGMIWFFLVWPILMIAGCVWIVLDR